jgi:hypothetical protein
MIKDVVVPTRMVTVRSRSLSGSLRELVEYAAKEKLGDSGFVRMLGAPAPGGYTLTVELEPKNGPLADRPIEHEG